MVRIRETAEEIEWYRRWLQKYLVETKQYVEQDINFVCRVCGTRYSNEKAAQECKHPRIHKIPRCENCGALLDLPLGYEMKEALWKAVGLSKYDHWYEGASLRITDFEMDVRGLGSGAEWSFCSLVCLKEWVKKEGWTKESPGPLIIS